MYKVRSYSISLFEPCVREIFLSFVSGFPQIEFAGNEI